MIKEANEGGGHHQEIREDGSQKGHLKRQKGEGDLVSQSAIHSARRSRTVAISDHPEYARLRLGLGGMDWKKIRSILTKRG